MGPCSYVHVLVLSIDHRSSVHNFLTHHSLFENRRFSRLQSADWFFFFLYLFYLFPNEDWELLWSHGGKPQAIIGSIHP